MISQEHCRAMFKRFGLDTSKIDKYGPELSQEDLDELTGYKQRMKELNAMHECWKIIGILSGIIVILTATIGVIRHFASNERA